jgi:hypothetical protein
MSSRWQANIPTAFIVLALALSFARSYGFF